MDLILFHNAWKRQLIWVDLVRVGSLSEFTLLPLINIRGKFHFILGLTSQFLEL